MLDVFVYFVLFYQVLHFFLMLSVFFIDDDKWKLKILYLNKVIKICNFRGHQLLIAPEV